jgi:4a-hydroxytetrahydrobiopterin dehydratase
MKLSAQQREEALGALSGWTFDAGGDGGGAIARGFAFRDFGQAFAFMTEVALAAEKADHHPDWSNSWNKVEIRLTTHSEGGVTGRDIALARRIDAIARFPCPRPDARLEGLPPGHAERWPSGRRRSPGK